MLSAWGRPVGGELAEGHSAARLAPVADRLLAPLYFERVPQMCEQLERLRRELGDLGRVTAILLALEGEGPSIEEAVSAVAGAGVAGIAFYNHAFLRNEALDAVGRATGRLRHL
jgi:hypothetical protein